MPARHVGTGARMLRFARPVSCRMGIHSQNAKSHGRIHTREAREAARSGAQALAYGHGLNGRIRFFLVTAPERRSKASRHSWPATWGLIPGIRDPK